MHTQSQPHVRCQVHRRALIFAQAGGCQLHESVILGQQHANAARHARPQTPPFGASRARPSRAHWTARFSHYLTRPLLQLGPLLFGTSVLAALIYAWTIRNEGHWTAENGVGYWLGIAGSVAMLVLVLYPLRKRFRILHGLGRVASWFRLHMVLGILGPALIILHCNFKIGSLNSALALFTMLVVVASGIVGRYLYSQVHKGLYGTRAAATEILSDVEELKKQLGIDLEDGTPLFAGLEQFNASISATPKSTIGGLWAALTVGGRARRARRRFLRAADASLRRLMQQWPARERRRRRNEMHAHLQLYFAAAVKAQRLALYERLFGLWHVLHMPLFVLLVLTAIIHIVAVHLY